MCDNDEVSSVFKMNNMMLLKGFIGMSLSSERNNVKNICYIKRKTFFS